MNSLVVEPVVSWWQRRQFLNLPWDIYRGSPHWIPPLRGNQKQMLNYTPSPFFREAEIQTFLATRGGRPVGRIAAIVNHPHNRRFAEQRGFVGFFESEDQQETAAALVNTAQTWLAARGMNKLRGPANPSMNHECGLLVDGFDQSPTFMNTYNLPYYPALFEACGFRKSQDMYAFWGSTNQLAEVAKRIEPLTKDCLSRFDIRIRRFDSRRFVEEVRLFLAIFNESFADVWGFVPMSAAETEHMAREMKALIVPELTAIAEIDGHAIGGVLALLDYNPRIKLIAGRLFPFGFMRLLYNRKAIKRIRVISANVISKYQKWGVGLVLLTQLLPTLQAWGIEEAEFSWVLESNTLSSKTLQRAGATITKTYRMFDKDLPTLRADK